MEKLKSYFTELTSDPDVLGPSERKKADRDTCISSQWAHEYEGIKENGFCLSHSDFHLSITSVPHICKFWTLYLEGLHRNLKKILHSLAPVTFPF